MLLFSLDPDCSFAPALAAELGEPLAQQEQRVFEDGEHKLRPLVDPRGEDVYVVCGLHGGPHESPRDKLVALLMFIGTLRDHGAARVSAVVPYLAYARKDRQTKPFDPLSLRYVAQLFEAVGTSQLIVLEVHNPAAFQNAFRLPTMHLDAYPLFGTLLRQWTGAGPLVLASPDPGGVKRVQVWREALGGQLDEPVGFAMVDKRRSAGVVSSSELVAGAVDGATVLLFDDLIASGETMRRAALALRREGARRVIALAAHGLFIGPAADVLADPQIDAVVVSDSVPAFRVAPAGALADKLTTVSTASLFAQAIRTCHAAWRH